MRHIRLVTLGFDQFTSDILWFNTLNYFGKQYAAHEDLDWFGHMCDLVTSLDPRARHAYEFCATLLSWVAREPLKSAALLDRAVDAEPDYWRYRYLRGFNAWYFLNDLKSAKKDFSTAAQLKDAPVFLASLASRLIAGNDNLDMAIRFLNDFIENTDDPVAKKALKGKLKRAYLSRDLRELNKLAARFAETRGAPASDLSELVDAGMLREIPLDPWRKPYVIDSATNEVRTSSGKKGLNFAGKTAETGLASKERL